MCKGRMQSSQSGGGDSAETNAGAGGEALEPRILMEDNVFGDIVARMVISENAIAKTGIYSKLK